MYLLCVHIDMSMYMYMCMYMHMSMYMYERLPQVRSARAVFVIDDGRHIKASNLAHWHAPRRITPSIPLSRV